MCKAAKRRLKNGERAIREVHRRRNRVLYEEQENANTKKKTSYDIKLFKEFLESEGEERDIQEIPANKLQELATRFVLGVRKKNGEEYEPSSIRGFLQSVHRFLRKKGYQFSLLNDKEFCQLQDILKKKQKHLKAIGKGNKPNRGDALTDEEIDEFYRVGVLGNATPRALLNTDWMNNCTYFGMRPGQEQRDLCWGDLQLKTNTDGLRFVAFSTEPKQKHTRAKTPKMSEKSGQRCLKTSKVPNAVLPPPIWPINNKDHRK